MRLPTPRRLLLAVTTAAVLGAAVVSLAPAADAAALHVAYDVTGSTTVAKTKSSITLGPAVLSTTIASSGKFSGSLNLPPATTSFNALGLLPTSGTVTFVAAKATTGSLVSNPKPKINATASYYVKLSNVTVLGLPVPVGTKCQTADPVTMTVSGKFSVVKGGTLTGTYTIGKFANCGLTTFLLNALLAGPGNTVSLTLANGRQVAG
ncbi:hypothetical protein [Jatrophihabitans sp.]|uniref:hypothetical protein n=1 Tax=Jatrophihabitans sp. TaxID=1932789 RepID=UPI0030C6B83D|nr:hypothetical protein [Jatrophihabitans sp.]